MRLWKVTGKKRKETGLVLLLDTGYLLLERRNKNQKDIPCGAKGA